MRNEDFIKTAVKYIPELIETWIEAEVPEKLLREKDSVILDFKNHQVGYFKAEFDYEGSYPDAPVLLQVQFAEQLCEFEENADAYEGWISKSWIQEEKIHLDRLPFALDLKRRYAFRYVKITILAISSKFSLRLSKAEMRAVSSADDERLLPFKGNGERERQLDRIACRTLHNCMQKVFEDGPKRDRRLWIGDLRLQALANYQTYRMNDMVKSNLYLFAGDTLANGQVSAAVFTDTDIVADDVSMFDYSLFFIAVLRDYIAETKDMETLQELFPTAVRQKEIAEEQFTEEGIIKDSDVMGWCFVDWNLHLNKQVSAQGIYLYCLKALIELAEWIGKEKLAAEYKEEYEKKAVAAKRIFFDETIGLFVSGKERQVSYASQVWMILSGTLTAEEGKEILNALSKWEYAEKMVTPYMYHHYIDALIEAGEREKAKEVLMVYWGAMADAGADTFWELYDPDHPEASPYGGTIVNSYCHAWSCAPAYFLRKYFTEREI